MSAKRHRRLTRGTALFLALASLAVLAPAVAWAVGELTQDPGTGACVSEDGSGGACEDGKGLTTPFAVDVSPDGDNVYVIASGPGGNGSVAIFDRNATTGVLTQKAGTAGCISEDGTGGACQDGKALSGPRGVAVSPDGASVYVASAANAIAVFDRDTTTGALTQKAGTDGCISDDGSGGACQDGVLLDAPAAVTVDPIDGKSVYAVSQSCCGGIGAVNIFDRDTTTGELTQKTGTDGCISEDGSAGACQDGKALLEPVALTISPDGENVYVGSAVSRSVGVFDRDTTTGELAQKAGTDGCISEDGSGGDCQDGKAIEGPEFNGTAMSSDGKSLYVATIFSDGFAVFDRDTTTGALTQKTGTDGCVSEDGTGGACQDGTMVDGATGVATSPGGENVYVLSQTFDSVATFDRNTTATGEVTQKAATDGCISEDGTGGACQDGKALNLAFDVVVSPDGRHLYVASRFSNAVAVLNRAGGASPPPPPPPAPPPGTTIPSRPGATSAQAELPKPEVGKNVNVNVVRGVVRIKQPGEGSFRTLAGDDQIRMGSLIDTTKGRVRLTSAAGNGKTQTADFYDGLFKVTQTRGKKPITDLRLAGKLVGCSSKKASTAAKKRRGRRLWGKGKGRFRTRGKRSSALVRGTWWLVEDRCDSTLTRVRQGVVRVRDFARKRNVTVRAGGGYVARPR